MFSLQGKTALVTGAASGIGRAIAAMFAQQGAHVLALDISEAVLAASLPELRAWDAHAKGVACDVSNAEAVRGTFAKFDAQHETIDILVNSAGIAHVGTIETTDEEAFDRLYRVNVKGLYLCAREAVTRMHARGGGVVLNLASIAALIGVEDRFAYSMTKGAVLAMTRSIALDSIAKNVRCNCICPARIHTPFVDGFLAKNYPGREQEMFATLSQYQPIGRMGTPNEVAAMALYLCSDESAFVTGQAFPLDGGVLLK
jgi:NAD(P)-dependent dehydrogenase (short-subunit alcohol dehydrogenase family)